MGEVDRWAVRGDVGRQEGWRMTAGRGWVSLTGSRCGDDYLGVGVNLTARKGVEDDH